MPSSTPSAPAREAQSSLDAALFSNAQEFHHLVDCAVALQRSTSRPTDSLDGRDVLTFIWHILSGTPIHTDATIVPWAETDRLISLAKNLAHDAICLAPSVVRPQSRAVRSRASQRKRRAVVYGPSSVYWADRVDGAETSHPNAHGSRSEADFQRHYSAAVCQGNFLSCLGTTSLRAPKSRESVTPWTARVAEGMTCSPPPHSSRGSDRIYDNTLAEASPYFSLRAGKTSPEKKVKAGIVASVPFPPLFSTQFGLIQEKLAHDPFWLLIAVTFLIKTSGQVAIPAFHKVKERFPTPQQLADAGNAVELLDMIRHLGLAKNRLGFIQRYATAFLKQPPSPGVVYKVRNYDRRDPSLAVLEADQRPKASNGDPAATILEGAGADAEGWEIGHMTQGKYTLDSWRIFCRDEFLGRAEDWTGKGREPEFQPEWMRVMPHDKELRAYLRWMWMREGWEWNPETGERTVLGRELMEAVNEQRVAYDDAGGLRIVAVARDEGP